MISGDLICFVSVGDGVNVNGHAWLDKFGRYAVANIANTDSSAKYDVHP